MTTKRRSGRAKKPTKYEAESSEEDEENEDPKIKKARTKLKDMMRDDSDAESDFEKDVLQKEELVAEESDDYVSDDETKKKPKTEALFNGNHFKGSGSKGLQLSESDSSDDEASQSTQVSDGSKHTTQAVESQSYFGAEDDSGSEEDASQALLALAGNLEAIKEAWSEKPAQEVKDDSKKVGKKTKTSRKRAEVMPECLPNQELGGEVNISSLLAQGEGVVKVEEELEEEEEEEDLDNKEPVISKEGVQISIALPDNMRKKKKKGFDVAAYIKREMGKARRELQVRARLSTSDSDPLLPPLTGC